MLNQDTKRKIDSARDILVGKVPDPKAQVEQITTALIYKFMDDMDKESQEIGGKAKFFTNGFEKYAWTKLMNPKLGGNERLNLYLESITQLSLNPHIPQLFRDIFKDAFLPYRSPETLGLFLKEINGFTYGDSENLGDAFEYLLSILGSQGEAGQFRTPRHIIDFIVAAIDPKKGDTICDPACGTAGFLISAYKHILKQHDGLDDPENKEKPLTPDERKTLMDHFVGYDISPDMVRLSKVNMYLHGFPNPTIYEYDTLSSEERWDENFDVMLANPPFMTPRGGIRPHRRFGVQANRSEVLFVDYILEHLRPNGRAGIIVPEGIIFQSANAYKALRKLLVEDGLLAVVSLPAGVFNPYAGVKTSILIFDKALARRTKHVLFIKIQSDGLDLGAQRRPVVANDLPLALEALTGYRKFLTSGDIPDESGWPGIAEVDTNPLCQFVSKEEIGKIGDYNLSGDRYKEVVNFANQKWPMVELGEICDFINGLWKGKKPPYKKIRVIRNTNFSKDGKLNLQDVAELDVEVGQFEKRALQNGDIILEKSGGGPTQPVGRVVLFDLKENNYSFSNFTSSIRIKDKTILSPFFLWAYLDNLYKNGYTENLQKQTSGIRNLDFNAYKSIKIPLPPIEVQKEIVEQIEKYQMIVDGAKQVVENWKPYIKIDPKWEWFKVEDITTKGKNSIKAGPFGSSLKKETYVQDGYKIYGQEQVIKGDIDYGDYYIDEQTYKKLESCSVRAGDILISLVGTYGKLLIVPETFKPGIINPRLMKITLDKVKCLPAYFKAIFESDDIKNQVKNMSYGGTMGILNTTILRKLKMPIPPREIQEQIVERIEAERTLVEGNKKLIEIMEQKIADVLSGI